MQEAGLPFTPVLWVKSGVKLQVEGGRRDGSLSTSSRVAAYNGMMRSTVEPNGSEESYIAPKSGARLGCDGSRRIVERREISREIECGGG